MRVFYIVFILISTTPLLAQWTPTTTDPSVDIYRTGKIGIGVAPSYDLDIVRNGVEASIREFNNSTTGRSYFMVGQDFGGKYGYLQHNAQSYNAGTGMTQAFKSASTTLVGGDVNGLGILSNQDIRISTGGLYDVNQRVIINSSGNVGIGSSTLSPVQKLQVVGNIRIDGNGGFTHSELEFYRGDGFKFVTIGQADLGNANSTFDINHHNGNDIRFVINDIEMLRIKATGQVQAKEVKVCASLPCPDYVFESGYDLTSLRDLESYVTQNKHLPGVPSAIEMETNGILLSEMNMILLKKVEELTLYVIALKQQNEKQQQITSMQEEQIQSILQTVNNQDERK
jgi:hypothetical protein